MVLQFEILRVVINLLLILALLLDPLKNLEVSITLGLSQSTNKSASMPEF